MNATTDPGLPDPPENLIAPEESNVRHWTQLIIDAVNEPGWRERHVEAIIRELLTADTQYCANDKSIEEMGATIAELRAKARLTQDELAAERDARQRSEQSPSLANTKQTKPAIITKFVNPPIGIRYCDWQAYREDYDEGMPIGWGRTEQLAIDDLLAQEDDAR